jgi:hypothetical protein
MTQPRRTPSADRLFWLLHELGYVDGKGLQLRRLVNDINRRARGNVDADMFRAILHRGREIACNELLVICEGLDIDPDEILYDEDGKPGRRRRPKGVNLMDVIEHPL